MEKGKLSTLREKFFFSGDIRHLSRVFYLPFSYFSIRYHTTDTKDRMIVYIFMLCFQTASRALRMRAPSEGNREVKRERSDRL